MRWIANVYLVLALLVWAVSVCLLLGGCAVDKCSVTYQPEPFQISIQLELSK